MAMLYGHCMDSVLQPHQPPTDIVKQPCPELEFATWIHIACIYENNAETM